MNYTLFYSVLNLGSLPFGETYVNLLKFIGPSNGR